MLEKIAEHYVETSLLNGGICIDVGCLGFEFSGEMKRRGLEVYAFDIQKLDAPDGIHFVNAAVTNRLGEVSYRPMNDPQACYIDGMGSVRVESLSLNMIYSLIGKEINCLKIDAESSEYIILSDHEFKPVPKQISVEFHMHAHKAMHLIYYEKCMGNLLKYYNPVVHELTEAHGLGFNYWSSLFVRKDLL